MAKPTSTHIHDKFFRSAMEHKPVAIDFIRHHLPKKISLALNTDSLKLLQQSYIDSDLQECISDLVFSCKLANKSAYLALLIEHQSSPDKMLPFRIYHYLFSILNSYRKQYPDKPLPAVYTMVFYHGDKTPYPYSLSLLDCFDDPLALMRDVLSKDIPLIDVNQLSDQCLKQQQWVGPMALAMKHSRKQNKARIALEILACLPWPMHEKEGKQLLKLLLNYLVGTGNIGDIQAFIQASHKQLSGPLRKEMMNFEEHIEEIAIQKGIEQGIEQGRSEKMKEVALKMLEENVETAFITRVTGLSLAELARLQQQ